MKDWPHHYKLITGEQYEFEKFVSLNIAAGWVAQGGVAFVGVGNKLLFVQAMVRLEKVEKITDLNERIGSIEQEWKKMSE